MTVDYIASEDAETLSIANPVRTLKKNEKTKKKNDED